VPEPHLPDLGRRFRDPRRLGAGAGGAVHAVSDGVRRRDVALKLLPAGEEPAEFRTLRQLEHSGIVRVLDVGRAPSGEAWFTMELVRGRPFGEPGAARAVGPALVRVAMLLDALAALHDRGWVHGDLKPDNVLVGDDDRPVLIDFGLALGRDDVERGLRGTLGWIAPEVLAGGDASGLSDLYSLGVLAYSEFCGALPFDLDAHAPGLEPSEAVQAAREDPRAAAINRWLADLLRRDPGLRPPDARAALASLEALAGEGLVPPADRAARLGPTRPFRREAVIERAARAARDGALVFVVGPAGAGRTTVLREVEDRLRAGGGTPRVLVLGGGAGVERRSVEAFLADHGASLPARSDAAERDPARAHEAWQQRRTELGLHLDEATRGASVLLVDDLQPVSLVGSVLLERLGRREGTGAVCAVDPEGADAVGRAVHARGGGASLVLALEPLGVDDVSGWLRAALGPVRSLRGLAAWLVEGTGGLPSALRTRVGELLADGLLQPGEAGWRWDPGALDAWARAAAQGPDGADAAQLAAEAEAAHAEGDLRLAAHLARRALAGVGTDDAARAHLSLLLGAALRDTGEPRAAAEAFAEARALLPPDEACSAALHEAEARTIAGEAEAALSLLEALDVPGDLEAERARVRGRALLGLGRYDEAREEARALRAAARSPRDHAEAAVFAANIAIFQGRGAEAEAVARDALQALPPTLDAGSLGPVHVALGNALRLQGRLDEAAVPYESALAQLKRAGRLLDAARVANNLGILRYQQGDPLAALAAWEEFRDHARRGGVSLEHFNALNNLGCVYRDTGQPARARQSLEEALAIARAEAPTGLPMILGNLAEVEAVAGQPERAEGLYRECIDAAREQGNAAEEAEAWRRLAQARLDAGLLEDLEAVLAQARDAAEAADAGLERLIVRGLSQALAIRRGGPGDPLDEGLEVADAIDEAGVAFEADRLRLRLVEALAAVDRMQEAELRLDELEARLRAVSARPELVRVDRVRRQLRENTRYHLADISRHYDALQDLTLALSRERDLGRLLDLILARALELVGEERGYVILLDDDGAPILTASRLVGDEAISHELAPSRSVTRRVMESRKPMVVLDVEKEDSLRKRRSVMAAGLRSVLCVPILRGDDLLGVI
jgi:tetratricopeptide (TPR) repeat protein